MMEENQFLEAGLLRQLADSMHRMQYEAVQLLPEDLPPITDGGMPYAWLVLAVLGCALFALGGRKLVLRKRLERKWPALSAFVCGGGDTEAALYEFKRLELLSAMIEGDALLGGGEWFALTDSEQAVALGTVMDKSTKELAEKLACTPSYIYNVRASIRKKWNLDSDVNLRSAIAERYAQTGKPMPE